MCVCVEESRLQPQLLFLLFVWSFQWIFSDTQQFPTRKENRLLVRRDNYVKLFSKAMGLDVPLLGFVYVRGEEMRRVFQNWNTQQNEVRIDGGLQTVEETEESTSCRVSLGLKWTRQHGVLKEDSADATMVIAGGGACIVIKRPTYQCLASPVCILICPWVRFQTPMDALACDR